MRIAIVNKFLESSGMMKWAAGLSNGLENAGAKTTLVFLQYGALSDKVRSLLIGHSVVYPHDTFAAKASNKLSMLLFRKYLSESFFKESSPNLFFWSIVPFLHSWRKRFDVIVASDELSAVTGFISNLFWRIPYVVYVHEPPSPIEPFPISFIHKQLRRTIFKRALMLVSISSKTMKNLESFSEIPAFIIPSGCSPESDILLKKELFVLCDTRWSVQRNPFFVIEVAKRCPEIIFIIAGSFPDKAVKSDLQRAISHEKLGERLLIRDELDEQTLSRLYKQSAVWIRWAGREGNYTPESGSSMGIYQAISAGCPVVVDEELGLDDDLKYKLGDMVVTFEAKRFSEVINRLFHDETMRTEYSIKVWNISKELTWDKRASQLLESINQTLDSKQQVL